MNLICFSNLSWNQNYPRTKFLLNCFSKHYVTYYVEECEFNEKEDGYELISTIENVLVISPHLTEKKNSDNEKNLRLAKVIKDLFNEEGISDYIFWYYTPMAFAFTKGFKPKVSIYDCIDEKRVFNFTDIYAKSLKQELSERADIVFEGSESDEHVDKKMWHLTYVEMQKILKSRLGGEKVKKIIKLPRLFENTNIGSTESFGN